jgi:triphosphoribosyl-dephospho-CoA synthase
MRSMKSLEARVAAAYIEACLAELDAPKPGNVHRFAPGHRMEVADFVRSAEASAAPIAARGARVGSRIREAVDATLKAVGQNTNLGIILLCAPLAAAAEAQEVALRVALAKALDGLNRTDAEDVFAAIAAANPGGLGRAPRHDVNAPAAVTLREAMAEAADRDRIARQYVTAYEDIFSLGLPALAAARRRYVDSRWSTLAVYLTFLAEIADTHIARKFDAATAESVRREAVDWRDAFASARDPEGIADSLLGWDATLKSGGINPGTGADLTVTTLFASSLAAIRDDKCAAAILPSRANDD